MHDLNNSDVTDNKFLTKILWVTLITVIIIAASVFYAICTMPTIG